MDFEQRPGLKWCSFFCRIATMENEGLRSSVVLDRWEEEERCLSKWELCRVGKELRKFRHFKLTLDKDLIAMDEGSKMGAKMATTRIKLVRNKREVQIEYRMRYLKESIDQIVTFFKSGSAISQNLALKTAATLQMTIDGVKRTAQEQVTRALREKSSLRGKQVQQVPAELTGAELTGGLQNILALFDSG